MTSKKKTKTLDELLKEALVPEVEQPYELPKGWIWVNVDSVMTFVGGGTPSKSTLAYWNGDIPWATVKDIKGKYLNSTMDSITKEGLENSSANVAYPNELLLITRMSPGKTIITNIETAINQDLKIVRPKLSVLPEYMWLYFENNRGIIEHDSTGTTVKGIQVDRLKKYLFPLPPLHEQKRIVEKVERLLNKVEEAKQLIEEAKETFELRRAATLDKVFYGEFTKVFRKNQRNKTYIEFENNKVKKFKSQLDLQIKENLYVLPEGWKWVELNDLIENMTYGTSTKTNDDISGTPIIRMGNIQEGKVTKVNYKYLPTDHPDVLKFDVQTNDILFNRTNSYELVGKSAIITEEFEGKYSFASYLIRLRLVQKDILAPYIVQFINSHIGREMLLSMVTQQVGQANINSQKLASLMIPLPTIEEIKEINKRLKELENRERNTIKILKLDSTVNNLKQSILSKAFKGELGTNDPNDELAIELLKSILEESL